MAKNSKNGYKNRSAQEAEENLTVVNTTGAPSGRVQNSQQVATTMSATDVKPEGQPTIEIKEVEVPPQTVHTTKAAEVEKAARGLATSGSGVSGGAASLRATSYSGNSDTIVGDLSATTVLDKSDRKDTRTGKKLDNTLKHINYLYNEQVTVKYDESKPLAENPEATQGYNGTYRNEHARTQKHTGFVPADLYYDRSIDEIHQDFIYPVFGQSINDPAAKTIPSYDITSDEYVDFNLDRGNHMHTALNVTFNADGSIASFAFGDLDATPSAQDPEVANISALNSIIDANIAELDRQEMDAKAGDELDPKWSPLPRSIQAPTDTIALLRDIEGSTGAEIFMAYRKTAACFSYQLNKAAKDGQRIEGPMFEMIAGCMKDGNGHYDPNILKSKNEGQYPSIFTSDAYKQGAASLMIDLFDSHNKYATKGDMLLQPRGFRLHLQTADNNMNVFRVPSKFAQVVQANEVFSTIDHEYDPFLPVCISDKASLAHPYSFNTFIGSNRPKPFVYKYTNNTNNTYYVEVNHPLVKGLYDFMTRLGPKFVKNLTSDRSISIPCMHSTTGFSLWSLMLLAATPDIMKARIPAFIDVIDYEENFGYPFRQLVDMKTANPMYAKNYVNSDYNEPITLKKMDPATAIKWVMPENLWIAKENTASNEYVLPWYHSELQYDFDSGDKVILSDIKPCVMSMPSIRSGSRLAVLDTIYGMTERELRLSLDRQTVFPGYGLVDTSDAHVYKYGLTTDGQPMITIKDSDATLELWVKTPREIGWVIPCPNGMLTQTIKTFALTSDGDIDYENTTTGRLTYTDSFAEYGCATMRLRYWHGYDAKSASSILEKAAVNINRAMSLRQGFKAIVATRAAGDYRTYSAQDFIVSLSHCFNATAANPATVNSNSLFIPFVKATGNGQVESSASYKVVSLQKYYWTRLQRLGLAINQFDCIPSAKDLGSDDSVKSDPYDFLYVFGVAGFRGSDYNEDSYNREKVRLNLGMLFTEDPYFVDSAAYRL